MTETTKSEITDLIASVLCVDGDSLTAESRLDDLGVDSLDTVELVLALEEKFDIAFMDSEYDKLVTVGDVLAAVAKKRG